MSISSMSRVLIDRDTLALILKLDIGEQLLPSDLDLDDCRDKLERLSKCGIISLEIMQDEFTALFFLCQAKGCSEGLYERVMSMGVDIKPKHSMEAFRLVSNGGGIIDIYSAQRLIFALEEGISVMVCSEPSIFEDFISRRYGLKRLAISPTPLEILTLMKFVSKLNAKNPNEVVFKLMMPIYTPNDYIKWLPCGSTGLDFAYAIHSELGNRCQQVLITRGNYTFYSSPEISLQPSDKVEVISSEEINPDETWLSAVKTRSARKQIKAAIKSHYIKLGRNIFNDILPRSVREGVINNLRERLGYRFLSDLHYDLGKGIRSTRFLLMAMGEDQLNTSKSSLPEVIVIKVLMKDLPDTFRPVLNSFDHFLGYGSTDVRSLITNENGFAEAVLNVKTPVYVLEPLFKYLQVFSSVISTEIVPISLS